MHSIKYALGYTLHMMYVSGQLCILSNIWNVIICIEKPSVIHIVCISACIGELVTSHVRNPTGY